MADADFSKKVDDYIRNRRWGVPIEEVLAGPLKVTVGYINGEWRVNANGDFISLYRPEVIPLLSDIDPSTTRVPGVSVKEMDEMYSAGVSHEIQDEFRKARQFSYKSVTLKFDDGELDDVEHWKAEAAKWKALALKSDKTLLTLSGKKNLGNE